MRPSTSSISFGALIAVAGAFCSAVLMLVTRQLRGTSQTFMAFSQVCGTLLFGAVVAPFQWITPQWSHVGHLSRLPASSASAACSAPTAR